MLLCLSIDHRVSGVELLERIERHTSDISEAIDANSPSDGHVVIATCNRFEVYLDAAAGDDENHVAERVTNAMVDLITSTTRVPRRTLEQHVEIFVNDAAAEHLFSVASGLKSAVVGEGEIAGQVRRAHEQAQQSGSVTDALERLFQAAARTSRDVKHRTQLQSKGRSLVRLALALAEHRLTDWQQTNVLLVGTGAYAGATVSALRGRGAKRIQAYSPSGRAATFAASHEVAPVTAADFPAALDAADLVITCTSTRDPILTVAHMQRLPTMQPKLLIDLGVPRNIEPAVNTLDGIELLDIDSIAKHASMTELSAEHEAIALVQDAAAEFASSRAELGAVPTVVALRKHVLTILEDELCRARKGPSSTGPEAQATEVALRRLAGRILHEPTVRARALGREGRSDEAAAAAAALFGVAASA